MKNLKSMKDLPVYNMETGSILGNVLDLCFDDLGNIKGVLMDTKGLFKRDKIVPIHAISSFGRDGIMIGSDGDIQEKQKQTDSLHYVQGHEDGLIGKSLLTSEGDKLGIVDDVYFNEELGTIVGYEVTEGFFADMSEGRKIVKVQSPSVTSKDTVILQ